MDQFFERFITNLSEPTPLVWFAILAAFTMTISIILFARNAYIRAPQNELVRMSAPKIRSWIVIAAILFLTLTLLLFLLIVPFLA